MEAGADHGLAPERIARQLRASLERLGVDHVELYLAHEFDPDVPLADTIGALRGSSAEGRIGAYGVSNFDAAQLEAALAAGEPQAIQNSYSLLARAATSGTCCRCAQHRVAYLAFSPLAGGWLTGKYRRGEPFPAGSRMTQRPEPYAGVPTGATFDALDRLRAAGAGRGISMAGARAGVAARRRARDPDRRRPRPSRAPGAGPRGARAAADRDERAEIERRSA